jgi:UDP-glucose 4-epimerase
LALIQGREGFLVRTLITGAEGYIGRATYRALPNSVRVDIAHGGLDVRDSDALIHLIDEEEITDIIHLAAWTSVPESVEKPVHYYSHNMKGTQSVLEACWEMDVRLVFASTAAAENPCNPYGRSKSMCEQMIFDSGISAVILRYFNVGGGEMNFNSPLLVNRIARVADGIDGSLTVYGDGSQVRDYVHIDDVVSANLAALNYVKGIDGAVVVPIGTGVGSSVNEVIAACDEEIEVNYVGERPGDPRSLIADPQIAEEVLRWWPRKNLKDIVNSVYWRRI